MLMPSAVACGANKIEETFARIFPARWCAVHLSFPLPHSREPFKILFSCHPFQQQPPVCDALMGECKNT